VVGRTMSALCLVERGASAFIADIGCALLTPLPVAHGMIVGRRFR
jgi:hypothetical protein